MILAHVVRARNIKSVMADNMNQFVEIRKSEKHGNGLFAMKNFKKGESLYSLKKGRIVKHDEIQNLSELEKMHLDQIGKDEYEIIEPPGCYINHSCEPNVEEKDRTGYALRDIKKGEEITIDYDKIAYLEKPFECHCGSKNCRGFVRGRE
jgi:SET domain-containing protein